MKVDQFDRGILSAIDADVIEALKPVAEKYGIDISKGRGTFSNTNFTMKIEMSVVGDDGNAVTKEVRDYQSYAHLYDLSPEWLGKTFMNNGREFKICGLSMKAKKYPVLAECDGDTYKFTPAAVIAKMKNELVANGTVA